MKGELYRTLCEIGRGYDKHPVFMYREKGHVITVAYPDFMESVRQMYNYYSYIPQKRIGLWASNSYEWIVNAVGMLLSGKTLILLDVYLKEEDLQTLTRYADTELIVSEQEFMDTLQHPQELAPMKTLGLYGEREALKEDVEEGEFICFTSGTSNSAKGVVIPAKTLAEATAAGVVDFSGNPGERFFMPIPYYHIYGFAQLFNVIKRGGTVCIGQSRYLQAGIEEFRPHICMLVPSMVRYVVKQGLLQTPLYAVITGGAILDEEFVRKVEEKGIRLENAYGLSETIGELALGRTKGKGYRWLKPQEGVRFVTNTVGEVGIYLPFHMSEYYKKPEDTERVLDKEKHLFWTGDAGEIDEDGYVRIRGRLRDTVVMENGEKVFAEDIDEQLTELDGVKEAAVVGVDGRLGAVFVCEEGVSEEEIRNEVKRINKRNTSFSRIMKVWFRKEPLPRTSTGKLRRFELEKEYQGAV